LLTLALPAAADEAAVMDYRNEFLQAGDSMDGTCSLQRYENYGEWLSMVTDNRSEETVRSGLVPATTMLAWDDGCLIGMIDIRHRLNDYLFQFGGHIGYSVRPSCRRRGYAAQMLALALDECRNLGLSRVLVTCDRGNAASARTIVKNGGVLENEAAEGGSITQRYWIDLYHPIPRD